MYPTGLALYQEFLSGDEQHALLCAVDDMPWDNTLSRRTQHYGYKYDYVKKDTNQAAAPIPDFLMIIAQKLLDCRILSVLPDQVIVNEYLPGQGIGLHTDHVRLFDDGIVSVSLGAPIHMDFVSGNRRCDMCLPAGSALVLFGPARYNWQHGIVPRKSDYGVPRERRVSITFRKMK